jgi:hypothetical protein
MRRNAAGRLAKLEAAWYQEQCRRMDAMTDEELAGQIGSGAGEVMDGLSPDELALVAQGDAQAMQRFFEHLDRWQGMQ